MNDNTFWFSIWTLIVVGFLVLGSTILTYNRSIAEQIRTAPTCEAAVLIEGGHNVELKLIACALGRDIKELKKVPQ